MEPANGRLSKWNAYAVIVNKIKNLRPEDEPRMTMDYLKVYEDLLGTYLKLNSKVYNHLLNPNYGCLFMADFKHIYLMILLHLDN